MFRIADIVEIDYVQGLEKRTFRLELFEDASTHHIFRARLWEVQSLAVSNDRTLRFNGPLGTVDKSLLEKSILLPARFTSGFASASRETALQEVLEGFKIVREAAF